jgi:DNA repair protein RadC
MSCRVMESEDRMATAEDVSNFLQREMVHEKRELFMSVHLNTRLQIESKYIVSIGSLDAAPVHPREVFGPAVKRGAAAVIVAHNHPSGDPSPSAQDIAVTERLSEASKIMGIKLLDHVVIGSGRCFSMREAGYLTD